MLEQRFPAPENIAFSDLQHNIGRSFGPTDAICISQEMVDGFADLTGDHQWPHTDIVRAREELGGTIVHGYFMLSLIPICFSKLLTISDVGHALNYGLNKVRFPTGLPVGSYVVGTFGLIDVTPRNGGLLITCEHSITAIGADRPACVAKPMTLLLPGNGAFGGLEKYPSAL